MLSGALIFLVDTVFGLFVVALLLRFYLQWARVPYRNPLSEFLQALTDFMVRPARRLIPGLWGLDLASLALAWLLQFVRYGRALIRACGWARRQEWFSPQGADGVVMLAKIVSSSWWP